MNVIELAIAAQLIDHRDTSASLPPEFVCSLNEFAQLVRAAAMGEAVAVLEFHGFDDAVPYINWVKANPKEKT